ncbi:MAG: Thoeris anti-defense Tad2 family protein [Eubacteriales bacterium]
MNIYEAAKQAVAEGKYIARKNGFYGRIRFEATNDSNKLIMLHGKNRLPKRGWQPQADDLIATDWVVLCENEWTENNEVYETENQRYYKELKAKNGSL